MLAHVTVAVVVSLFAVAGLWQLGRLHEKQRARALVQLRSRLPEVPLDSIGGSPSSNAYRRVRFRGTFEPEREVVLRSRALREVPGHHLLTPLRASGGTGVIVDRGWVPFEWDKPPVQQALPPSGPVEVHGILVPPERKTLFGIREPARGVLRTVSRVDVPRLQAQIPYEVAPLYLLLRDQSPAQPAGYPKPAPLPRPDLGRHLSYAVQWFLFIPTALVCYGAFVRARRPRAAFL